MSFRPTYPYDLPLLPPTIDFKSQMYTDLLLQARTELAELKGYSASIPNPLLLISPAIIKESVASSNIENINTTIVDVLQTQLFPELEQQPPDKEVLCYRDALYWGFESLTSFALSTRLIGGIQKKLIPTSTGQYRKQQNQIINNVTNEVLYTPPIASEIPRLMSNWENFVNHPHVGMDPLIQCAMAHYQFEAIHPFSDGNGRTGRILMVLGLVQDKILHLPTLYISGYINARRTEYYTLLRGVTKEGKWNDFIFFMIKGFYLQAKETKDTLFQIMELLSETKEKVKTKLRKIYSADLVETLFTYPIITPVRLGRELELHYTTASRYLAALARGGLLKEGKYGKYHLFINEPLMKILKKERNV